MKRLSQTWKQKKSVHSKSTKSDQHEEGFKNPARQTNRPRIPDKNVDSPGLASPNASLCMSFGFDFDAAALSEMDKLEEEHAPTVSTTPIPYKRRVTEDNITIKSPEDCRRNLQNTPKCDKEQNKILKSRERISTPIEGTDLVLLSPHIPTFSPVNLAPNLGLADGDDEPKSPESGCSNSSSSNSSGTVVDVAPCSGSDARDLASWGLPPSVLRRYHDMGITHMFEWQVACLRTGKVLQGGNLVYSAPTSAGKTMVAELLMLKNVLETKRKALFILPYVSVAREKMFYLQRLFEEASVRVEGFMGSHSPAGGINAVDIAVCTIEKANSLLNRLLEENKVSTLGVVVVDEMHLIGDPHRGYLLELFLTKIQFVTGQGKSDSSNDSKVAESAIQVVCMSATLPNLDMLARWLEADLYYTDHRPVPLTEMVKVGPTIYDNTMKKIRDIDLTTAVAHDNDHVIPLSKETISNGHSVLIFCPTKNWCEKQAESIARHFSTIGNMALAKKNDPKSQKLNFVKASDLIAFDYEALREVLEQLARTPVGLDSVLKRIIPYGCAFHHAGLTVDERDIIEGAFRRGAVRVLVATSTLCSGVNLPARRVIIRTPTFHGRMIDPLVYKQMAGRAGRKGVDDLGESILVCKATERHKAVTLMGSELKAVQSCLLQKEQNGGMKRALLEVIASGVVTGLRDVERYASCTFFASSSSESDVNGSKPIITDTIKFLVDNEFIRVQVTKDKKSAEPGAEEVFTERYVPSQLGAATVSSALSPDEALVVFSELQKARKCFVLESELHIIYQVTPIYVETQWPNIDWNQYLHIWERLPPPMRRVADIVGIQEVYLSLACRGRTPKRTPQQQQQLRVHRRFFAALALQDLVHEVPINDVACRYGATKGMVQSLQGSASTFAGMVTVFCQRLGWLNLDLLLSQFQSRLSFGVERELCDLVRISVLNAARARMLYTAGFQTVASLAVCKSAEVETVLRNAVPFASERKHLGETDREVRHRSEARVFWVAGKKGLSEREAAVLIVTEAKELLRGDAAQLGIQWKAPEIPAPEIPAPEVPAPKASVHSKANNKIGSRLSRNAIDQSTLVNKRRRSRRRTSSGSFRKGKSPLVKHRQKSPHFVAVSDGGSNRYEVGGSSRGEREGEGSSKAEGGGMGREAGERSSKGTVGGGISKAVRYEDSSKDWGRSISTTTGCKDSSDGGGEGSSKAAGGGCMRTVTVPDTDNRLEGCEFKKPGQQKCLKNQVEIEDKMTVENNEKSALCNSTKYIGEELKIGKKYPTTKGKFKEINRRKVENDKKITSNENQDIQSRDMLPRNQNALIEIDGRPKDLLVKKASSLPNQERNGAVRKSGENVVSIERGKHPERRSEATDFISALISNVSHSTPNPARRTNKQSPPINEPGNKCDALRSANKRRALRNDPRSESPKQKLSRQEPSPEVAMQPRESGPNATQSFSVQDESCSSAVLFDNSIELCETKPNEPVAVFNTSPELYSEPFEDELNNRPTNEGRGGDQGQGSPALGFSMSDSCLAQCDDLSNHPVTPARPSPDLEPPEFDSISDDLIAQHCDMMSQQVVGQEDNCQVVNVQVDNFKEADCQEDNYQVDNFQEDSSVKHIRDNDNTNADVINKNAENDDVGSGVRFQLPGRSLVRNLCEPSCSPTYASRPLLALSSQAVGEDCEEEGLLDMDSFSLNLSFSESPSDDFRVLNVHDTMKGVPEKDKSAPPHTRGGTESTNQVRVNQEAISVENNDTESDGEEHKLTAVKSRPRSIAEPAIHSTAKFSKTPSRDQVTYRNLVVETPESDVISSGSVTPSNEESSPGSPCVDSPGTPSCTFTSVAMLDVSADELLFHTFIKEWKSRKEFSLAIGCERGLDHVPKIGGRLNKGPSTSRGTSKGLPIEGTDEVVVGVAVCWSGKDAYYVSLRHSDDVTDGSQEVSIIAGDLSIATRLEGIKSVLEYKGKRKGIKVCFDSTAQYKVLAQSCGITLSGECEDPKVAAWLLDPSSKEKTLHQLAAECAGDKSEILQGIGVEFGTGGYGLASQSSASGRARSCTEAVIVFWVMKELRLQMEKNGVDEAFQQVEMPVMKCLASMELNGIGFSDTECNRLKSILQAKLRTLEEEAYRLANHSFSLTSPDEIAMVLFLELRLPVDGKPEESFGAQRRAPCRATPSGGKRGRKTLKHMSTNKEVLERLKPLHPLPGVIMEWRRVNCTLTKVVYPVQREKMVNRRVNMNRIYSNTQIHTATGRVSFAEPNLQNVPRDFDIDLNTVSRPQGARLMTTRRTVSMRTTFVPFRGGVMLAADYSQLELRIIAHLSGDERLRRLLNTGGDVFRLIAGSINGIEPTAVNDVQRQRAKQICYGIIYGIGAKSLGEQLDVCEEDASVFIEKFKSRFSGIRRYLKTTVEDCRKNGFVLTVTNRRRYLPAINSPNGHARSQAERQAVNTTVQGSAADLVKIAMIHIDRKLAEMYPSCRLTHRHKTDENSDKQSTNRRRSSRISTQTPLSKTSTQSIKGAFVVLQLHDELILEVSEEDLNRVAVLVKKEMESAIKLSVMLPVKLKAGPSWGVMSALEL